MLFALLACTSRPPDVVFVVLDTVRAQQLSACGYERSTTPTLDALPGQLSCTAVAPGSWTLPSHASFMTGAMPLEHGAHSLTSGVGSLEGTSNRARPLNGALRTLAESYTAGGYQTIAVSGNPVVNEKMGLLRGFERAEVAASWGRLFGDALPERVDLVLDEADDRPLFLFVNIADAHQPWRTIPDDAPWGGGTRGVTWSKTNPEREWIRYVRGQLPDDEAAQLRARSTDLYDHALRRADTSLGMVLASLEAHGRCQDGCRVVITSDHGEFLGEHGLLDHGHEVWDENAVVPLFTSSGDLGRGWVSALDAHALVLGEPTRHAQISQAWPHVRRCARVAGDAFCDIAVGDWSGPEKHVWVDGELFVEVDGVRSPLDADADLVALGARVRKAARDDGDVDFQVEELLRAAGYLD